LKGLSTWKFVLTHWSHRLLIQTVQIDKSSAFFYWWVWKEQNQSHQNLQPIQYFRELYESGKKNYAVLDIKMVNFSLS